MKTMRIPYFTFYVSIKPIKMYWINVCGDLICTAYIFYTNFFNSSVVEYKIHGPMQQSQLQAILKDNIRPFVLYVSNKRAIHYSTYSYLNRI